MTAVEQAKTILDLKKLKLPPRPPIVAIEVEDYVDWEGEDSLQVYVILGEDTTDEDFEGDAVVDMKTAIRDALHAAGIEEFAYIVPAKRSELESAESE